jgi:hypothetical protein
MNDKRLETSQIIVPRPSRKTSKKGFVEYSIFDASRRIKGLETISRNIQWYRMWWTYLRLALECEEKNILIDGEKVKMDRRYYRKWNLDFILVNSFDNWWKESKTLFVHPPVKTLSASSVSDDDHLVLMVPKTRDKTDLLNELDELLEGKTKSVVKFPFSNSKATYLRCHMQYNIFVKATNGQKREQIRQWVNEVYQPMSLYMLQNKLDNDGNRIEEIISAENGVTNNIRYAKKRIVSTSRGVFP